jgi:tetratricopeptide (TPR) repeat protein
MTKNLILYIFFSFVNKNVTAQNLITSDLANFKYTFDHLQNVKTLKDTIDLIQQNLIEKASPTFKEYLDLKKQGGQNVINEYVRCLKNYPKYYLSVLDQSEIFKDKAQIKKIENAYKRLVKLYPNAKLKPNVICIGFMDDGGKPFPSGQYIGLEVFSCNEKADKSELNNFLKDYLGGGSFDLEKIDEVITHELVHLSQFKGDEKFGETFKGTIKYIPLLSEGGASFVTDYLYKYKATIGPGVFFKNN